MLLRFLQLSLFSILLVLFLTFFLQDVDAAACSKGNGGEDALEFVGGQWQSSTCFESCTNLYVRRWAKWDCADGDNDCDINSATAVCTYEVAYDNNSCPETSRSNRGCGTWCSAVGTTPCAPGVANCKCSSNEVCVDNTSNATPTQICTGSYGSPHGYCVQYACGYHCYSGDTYAPQECSVAYAPNAPSYGFDSKATCDASGGYNGTPCDRNAGCNGDCRTSADCGPGSSDGGFTCWGAPGKCRNPANPNSTTCAPTATCGNDGQACCSGGTCNPGFTCNSNNICEPTPTPVPGPACGASGQACCPGSNCYEGLNCVSGVCREPAPTQTPANGTIRISFFLDENNNGTRQSDENTLINRVWAGISLNPGTHEELAGEYGNNDGTVFFSATDIGPSTSVSLYIYDTATQRFVSTDPRLQRQSSPYAGLTAFLGQVNQNYLFEVLVQGTAVPTATPTPTPRPFLQTTGGNVHSN